MTLRIALYALAAAGLGGALYAIVSLHPHQQIYFSWLADQTSRSELGQQYDMDYWLASHLQGLEYLLESYPDTMLYVYAKDWPWSARKRALLPAAERERIVSRTYGRRIFISGWTDIRRRGRCRRIRWYTNSGPTAAPI